MPGFSFTSGGGANSETTLDKYRKTFQISKLPHKHSHLPILQTLLTDGFCKGDRPKNYTTPEKVPTHIKGTCFNII